MTGMVQPGSVTNIVTISTSLQAKRFADLLSKDSFLDLRVELAGSTDIIYLQWDGSLAVTEDWNRLRAILQVDRIHQYDLPQFPNFLSPRNKHLHSKMWGEILEMRPHLRQVFLFSYYSHYSSFAKLAKTRGLELSLVEEGLGSYKALDSRTAINEPGKVLGISFSFYSGLRAIMSGQSSFPKELGYLRRIPNAFPEIEPLGFRDFDNVYTSLPGVIQDIFPSAHVIETSKQQPESLHSQAREGNDSLFVAQPFRISPGAMEFTLRQALSVSTGRLIVSIHPRSSPEWKKIFIQVVRSIDPNSNLVKVSEKTSEELIRSSTFEWVLSLTSTVLLEAGAWDPGVRVRSVAGSLLNSHIRVGLLERRKLDSGHLILRMLGVDA